MEYDLTAPWIIGVLVLVIWDIIWKGLGLWAAANRQQKGWFIVMLVLNTAGLLPIIYLLIKKGEKNEHTSRK